MNNKITLTVLLTFVVLLADIISIPLIKSDSTPYWYNPTDATLSDNIYNVTKKPSVQWWYIDAVFTNNYSIHIGILTIGSKATNGFFLLRINVYKEGVLQDNQFTFIPMQYVKVSHSEPLIKINNKEILKGYLNSNNTLVTNISLQIKGLQAQLTLTSLTKGWKGFTGHGMWGCPIPKGHAQGTITIHDTTIPVNGTGYQEHGWDIQQLHRSWFWGKFSTNNTNVIFSQNMKNKKQEYNFICVVNLGENNYTSIKRQNITFTNTDYRFNHGRFIPTKAFLEINEHNIHIKVTIHVLYIHFTSMLFMNHWRFHAEVTGTVTIGNSTEDIQDFQIMELFHYP